MVLQPLRPGLAAALALGAALLGPLPAAALSLLGPDDVRWGPALAAATPEGFDAALAASGIATTSGATFRAETPAERIPGWDPMLPGGTGGALEIEDLGAGAWGASGAALSTRNLAWPYAVVVDFVMPVVALEAVWAAANADWRATAWDVSGALIGSVDVPGMGVGSPAGRLALGLDGWDALMGVSGIARLQLQSLGGYDWLYLDGLRLIAPGDATPRAPGGGGLSIEAEAPLAAAVPLPPALALIGAALAGLASLRRRSPRGVGCRGWISLRNG